MAREIVNCKKEFALFKHLLRVSGKKRILSIESPTNTGKSTLLDKFSDYCINEAKIPCVRVNLDDNNLPTPLSFARFIANELKEHIEFPTYDLSLEAYIDEDYDQIKEINHKISGTPVSSKVKKHGDTVTLSFDNANLSNSENLKVIAQQIIINNPESSERVLKAINNSVGFSDLQREQAEKILIMSVFYDLTDHCNRNIRDGRPKNKVLLLFDRYEAMNQTLKEWLHKFLMRFYFFDLEKRPRSLLLVIAGQNVPQYDENWSNQLCKQVVEYISPLSKWSTEDVKHAAKLEGIDEFADEIASVYAKRNINPIILLGYWREMSKKLEIASYE